MTHTPEQLIEMLEENRRHGVFDGGPPYLMVPKEDFDALILTMRQTCWQPIETAPKDEEILLWFPPPTDPREAWRGPTIINGEWFSSPKQIDDGWLTRNGFVGEPLFWMPLPPPPSDGETK